jgi:WD40 repeat protein
MRPLGFCLFLVLALPIVPGTQAAAPPRLRVDALGDPLPPRALARLGTSRFRLLNPRQMVALAPDGRTVAIFSPARDHVVLLDAISGRELRRFAAASDEGFAFLPSGNELVCASSGTLTFWSTRQGKELRRITVKAGREIASLSVDGGLVAAGPRTFGRKSPLILFEAQAGKQLATVEPVLSQNGAVLSPDGKWLASWAGSEGGARGRGRAFTGEELPRSSPTTVQLWDPATGKEVKKIESGLGESIAGVAFAPDRKTLALATSGGGIQLWDLQTGKRLRTWRGALRSTLPRDSLLAFSPDGKTLVVGSRSTPPLAWDLLSGRRMAPVLPPECQLVGIGFPGEGRIVACGVQGQAVVVWDLLSGKRLGEDMGHSAAIAALSFRGQRLSTMAADGSLIEWDLHGKEVRRLPVPRVLGPGPRGFGPGGFGPGGGPGRRPLRINADGVFSPNGTYLARRERFSEIAVSDVRTGLDLLTLSLSSSSGPPTVAFSPHGELLAVPSTSVRNPGVRLFRMRSGEELPLIDTETAPSALAFDPAGRRLAISLVPTEGGVAEKQGEVRLWRTDLEEQDEDFTAFTLPAALGSVAALVFSSDGNLLLVAHGGGAIHLLDAHTGRSVGLLDAGETLTAPPVLSPDGRTLVVASAGEGPGATLALWEMASCSKRWSIPVASAVTALAFAPSGKILATGHRDSSGLLWDVTGLLTSGPAPLGDGDAGLWTALVSDDAPKAFAAQCALACGGESAVAALRKRLRPAAGTPLAAATLADLVKKLDDDDFDARRAAFAALAKEGKSAESHLRAALGGKPSAEVARRAKQLLAQMGRHGASGEALRGVRALEVLEWIGTPARTLVEELARGRADHPLTREAQATLRRMRK